MNLPKKMKIEKQSPNKTNVKGIKPEIKDEIKDEIKNEIKDESMGK